MDSLRQEVLELTEMLRHDADFRDLRALLAAKGLDVAVVLKAGLVEDADGFQSGVFLTPDRAMYLYVRNAYDGHLEHWRR